MQFQIAVRRVILRWLWPRYRSGNHLCHLCYLFSLREEVVESIRKQANCAGLPGSTDAAQMVGLAKKPHFICPVPRVAVRLPTVLLITAMLALAPPPTPAEDQPLTALQKAFVAEYLIDRNAMRAAMRAGYVSGCYSLTGMREAALPNVQMAIKRATEQRASRVGITADSVLHEMSMLASSRIDWFVLDETDGIVKPTPEAPVGAMAAVQSAHIRKTIRETPNGVITITYDVDIKLWDKPGALKLLGRHVGLFPDKVEITGANGGPIETAVTEVRRIIVYPDGEAVPISEHNEP